MRVFILSVLSSLTPPSHMVAEPASPLTHMPRNKDESNSVNVVSHIHHQVP
uniref:Uncharacterized protein n=1 Tax=Arion vulgaris TaxID=1028688 RepID=A0A0B6ZU75_9EUPU